MKILKHGDLKPRKFTCSKCGCEFVADMTEYNEATYTDSWVEFEICCPMCKYWATKKGNDAPIYEGKIIDKNLAMGCDTLINFAQKKKEWYKIMHDILETMEELDNESKTNS